jgi:8-amino-7-oxononanoate synthase
VLLIDHLPGRTITVNNTEFLYFSGTSYLGMARNDQFTHFLTEGIQRYGTNYSSSRLSNLQLRIYDEAESYLAAFAGAEAALTISSGYLTGQVVVRLLENQGKFIFAPRTHPAVWLSSDNFLDQEFDEWTGRLIDHVNASPEPRIIIVSNSLDPLLARRYDFAWIADLPKNKEITLLIDDSHGFGIIGREGAGIFSELRSFSHIRLIVISSFGKAFGIPGGVILADR